VKRTGKPTPCVTSSHKGWLGTGHDVKLPGTNAWGGVKSPGLARNDSSGGFNGHFFGTAVA
jgi:hypothetical protein